MARKASSYSVSDLEKMLDSQRSELTKLETKREKLAADLADVDSRISELNGSAGAGSGGGGVRRATKKRTKKVASKKAAGGGGRGKRGGQPSLRKVILDVLPGGKPLSLDEVMDKVLATGYRSNAANFRQVVYLNLYNLAKKGEINHDSKTKQYSA